MKDRTRTIHPTRIDLPADNRPLVPPIYQSVKFCMSRIEDTLRALRGEGEGYFYSRLSNPTVRQLEQLLAQLQGREDCVVVGSGMAAVSSCLLALCKAGDHVLGFVETYGPSRYLIRQLLERYGVTCTLLSIEDEEGMARVLSATPTRLVFFESPTNPANKVADIARICAAARAAGALTVMDNTFAGFHNHGQFPVDLFVHSLTKYASGHGDVMGGAIIGSAAQVAAMRQDCQTLGAVLDPHAAFLLLRGMKTYFLRYAAQAESTLEVAAWLERQPQVRHLRHPGLPSHPRHELARRQMHDFGTVICLQLEGGMEACTRFVEALRFFAITASLGSVDSLVMPPQLLQPRDFTPEQRELSELTPATIRLSIGAEDTADLIEDLAQALIAAQ
ncbi:MAG: trans-sulfuration enzyme family protein [Steroidobacteraceae bacterium]